MTVSAMGRLVGVVLILSAGAARADWEPLDSFDESGLYAIYDHLVPGAKNQLLSLISERGNGNRPVVIRSLDLKTGKSAIVDRTDGVDGGGIALTPNGRVVYVGNHYSNGWFFFVRVGSPDDPTSFHTALDYQGPEQESTYAEGVGSHAGMIFAVGGQTKTGMTGTSAWLVMKSSDDGETWSRSDFLPSDRPAIAHAIAFTPTGAIVVGGRIYDSELNAWRGFFRRSADGGNTWQTVHETVDQGRYTNITEIVGAADGTLYALQMINDLTSARSYLLISKDDGLTWTESPIQPQNTFDAMLGLAVDPVSGDLFASGWWHDGAPGRWRTRKSTDGGMTWSIEDDAEGAAMSLLATPSGDLVAAGFNGQQAVLRHLVR